MPARRRTWCAGRCGSKPSQLEEALPVQVSGESLPHGIGRRTTLTADGTPQRLIEEQAQGRDHRIASPSAQSSSFKRISQAVGEPVK
ncbi:hypothetical protein TELCIR_21637 [Teladorsagia circumcincta]|uniref:Uncharacterized protein n=1 Tax=Teladorsagia circumcincta TaxID=45464 RepID=A0A2G9THE9_TELCI|nr:hypothetical protein TELCIR_21637 [Teladorsagia circumcincta]